MQLRRVVAKLLFVRKERPVVRRMSLANEKVAEEECDGPTDYDDDCSVDDASESFAFALGEDALVEEHEAELDQAQTGCLDQLD